MQVPVDAFSERAADSFDLCDLVDGCGFHAAQPAEMLQKGLPPPGSDTGDLAEHRRSARLAPARTMADDGEAVRLVADGLDQVQPRVRRRELDAPRFRLED